MDAGGCRGASLGAVVLASLVVVWFLFIGILANQASENAASRTSSSVNPNVFTRVPGGPSFISDSKRRVPDGPDPIHNRKAGNWRLPPTRA